MGESRSRRVSNRTNMKTLFFVAAFVALALGAPQLDDKQSESGPNADASADPWYGYYGYGYRPYGYGYYGHDTLATMERDLLMLSQLPMLLPTLRLILGTDTTDMDTGLTGVDTMVTDMVTMDTAHTVITGVKLKPTTTCCFSLPTLL